MRRPPSTVLKSARHRTVRELARALALALVCLLPAGVQAQSDAAARERGLALAREGRCDGALTELEPLRQATPADAEVALVAGQCWIRLQRYGQAVEALQAARAADPELPGVDVSLAIALYHQGDRDAARQALSRALARDPERANVQLYRGLMLLDDGRDEEGVAALERARRLDPAWAEPVASFYQGAALAARDPERARPPLERVVADWPDSAWADEARRILARLDAADDPVWWLEGTIGAEYDTNVVLKGSSVELPSDISDEGDWRGVWTVSAGSTVYHDESWTLGVMGGYYGTRQHDVTQFDTHYPTASAWVDRALGDDALARLRYEFGYAWVDGDDYLLEHALEGSLFRDFGDVGRTRLQLRFVADDFKFDTFDVPGGNGTPGQPCPGNVTSCGPPGLDEARARNRDGWEISAGLLHVLPLPPLEGWIDSPSVRAGYAWSMYDARGQEYSYRQHAVTVGTAAILPGALRFDFEAGFAYRPYRNASTFPDRTPTNGTEYGLPGSHKREREWSTAASFERSIWKQLSLVLDWRYVDNQSTAKVFDYDRHVVGLRLKGRIGP